MPTAPSRLCVAPASSLADDAVNILVLGATGLLGNAMFRSLSTAGARVYGTIRNEAARNLFAPGHADRLTVLDDVENTNSLASVFDARSPDLVVNCIAAGRPAPTDPMRSFQVYSVLPRRLAHLCR